MCPSGDISYLSRWDTLSCGDFPRTPLLISEQLIPRIINRVIDIDSNTVGFKLNSALHQHRAVAFGNGENVVCVAPCASDVKAIILHLHEIIGL